MVNRLQQALLKTYDGRPVEVSTRVWPFLLSLLSILVLLVISFLSNLVLSRYHFFFLNLPGIAIVLVSMRLVWKGKYEAGSNLILILFGLLVTTALAYIQETIIVLAPHTFNAIVFLCLVFFIVYSGIFSVKKYQLYIVAAYSLVFIIADYLFFQKDSEIDYIIFGVITICLVFLSAAYFIHQIITEAGASIQEKNRLREALQKDYEKLQDIEKALRQSEERYKAAFEDAAAGMAEIGLDGIIRRVNPKGASMLGYGRDELEGLHFKDITHQEDLDVSPGAYSAILKGKKKTVTMEKRYVHKEGKILWMRFHVSPVRNRENSKVAYFIVQLEDITENKKWQEQVERSLEEKETLIKEIHHRVKNNLALIRSFISLQSKQIESEETRNLLNELANKISSIGLIHDKLYRSSDLRRVDFHDYLADLVPNIIDSTQGKARSLRYDLDIENIELAVDKVIPLGIIITELLTNVLKYAYPNNEQGTFSIQFSMNEGFYTLRVSDDGVGIPEDIDIDNPQTFGLGVIKALSSQLDAGLRYVRNEPNSFVFAIPAEKKAVPA